MYLQKLLVLIEFFNFVSFIIGASLSKPHYNVENGTVVYAWRTVVKNRIAAHYYSLVQ